MCIRTLHMGGGGTYMGEEGPLSNEKHVYAACLKIEARTLD